MADHDGEHVFQSINTCRKSSSTAYRKSSFIQNMSVFKRRRTETGAASQRDQYANSPRVMSRDLGIGNGIYYEIFPIMKYNNQPARESIGAYRVTKKNIVNVELTRKGSWTDRLKCIIEGREYSNITMNAFDDCFYAVLREE